MSPAPTLPLLKMADAGMQINAVLMVLNLLPLPPLDGGRIAVSLLPHHLAWRFARLEPYGFQILLVPLFLSACSRHPVAAGLPASALCWCPDRHLRRCAHESAA